MKKNSILFILILLFTSCKTKPKEAASGLPQLIFKIDSKEEATDSSGYCGLALRLFENGTYSHFAFNYYAYGKWIWDEKNETLFLKPTSAKHDLVEQNYKIEKTEGGIYFIRRKIKKDNKIFIEKNDHRILGINSIISKDIFSKDLNSWRVKPKKAESKSEIRERTLGYLKFQLGLYDFFVENKIDYLSNTWYPTPIQMHYSNGARMSYNNELVDWNSCFFSIDDANEAYNLIARAMQKSKIDGAMTDLAKRNILYIKQLIKAIESD